MSAFRLRAAPVAAIVLTSLTFLAARAQTAPPQSVVVTGARVPLASDQLAADVVVISAETLRSTSADSLADVLRREAGMQISRTGGPGQGTGIFIRGATSQQTVVLIDGVRVGSDTLGFAALESVPLAQVDHIEILRGPGSSLYGADAVGGVVQVFTKAGTGGPKAELRAAVGGYGSQEYSGGLRGSSGAWDYAATVASEKSRGVSALGPNDPYGNYNPDRDGYALASGQLRIGLRPAADQRIGLTLVRNHISAQYDSSEYLPPLYQQNSAPDFRNHQTTEVAAVDWRGALAAGLSGSARLSSSADDDFTGADALSTFRTTRQQASAQLAWQTGALGQLVGALEHSRDAGRSSDYTGPVSRRTTAVMAELTGAAAGWSWQGDLRRDDNSDFGAVTTGSLGGGYVLRPGLRLRLQAGTTFRAPSYNDLYYPGYGVATLQPEHGRSAEVGLAWRTAASEASLTVFRNAVRNLIGYQPDPTQCPPGPAYPYGCAGNTSRARLQGATLAGAQRAGAWSFKAQLDFLAANDETTGARLPRRAAHQGTLGADWTAGDWTVGATVLLLGGRPDVGGYWLAPENTLNLAAQWRAAPRWEWQLKLLNATNVTQVPAYGYQGLGRQAWLVLRYEPAL